MMERVPKIYVALWVLALWCLTGCRPAAAPLALQTPTLLRPVIGTSWPAGTGVPPGPVEPIGTAMPAASHVPAPTPSLDNSNSSGILLSAVIGPACPGPERPGQVCTQPYHGLFSITTANHSEVSGVTTDENGQATIALPPGQYTVTLRTGGVRPVAAPVVVHVTAGQFVAVNITLDSGLR